MREGEADALQALDLPAAAQQLAERLPFPELRPIGVDVLAEQRDFEHPVGDQRADLAQTVAGAAVPFSFPARLGTMQKVQVSLQPTEIETQAE